MINRATLLVLAAATCVAGNAVAQEVAPSDYSDQAAWLCLPGRFDTCAIDHATTIVGADGTLALENWSPDPTAPIDCFYVYPTVSTDPEAFSDLNADAAELNVIRQQFARFGSVCRTYAPIYRQMTLAGLRSRLAGGARDIVEPVNYNDVRAAWQHYLERYNDGRGVVLIGHSQGSSLLRQLIAEEIDGRPVQDRLISAMLIGMTIPVRADGQLGGAFQHIPVCRSASDTGCLVSYVSFRSTVAPPENTLFGAVPDPSLVAACTNPSELLGRDGELRSYLSTSGRTITSSRAAAAWVTPDREILTPFVSVPGLLTARCATNEHATYLEVTVHGDPSDPRVDDIGGDLTPNWGLHLVDVNIAMGDLVELAERQGEAWLARRGR